MDDTMRQTAPYPHELAGIISQLHYRPGWTFGLRDVVRDPAETHGAEGAGLTFIITTSGYDSYNVDKGETYRVNHYFIVPAATYNRASWLRWVFDCFHRVETHECMEFFVVDGERPFAPLHGPGDDPYVIHEFATDLQKRTQFTGEVVNA